MSEHDRNKSSSQVATALENIARTETCDELAFDPATGTLIVRPAGASDGSTDGLPATQMAREGFFGPVEGA